MTAKTEYVNLRSWSTLMDTFIRLLFSCVWVVLLLLNTVGKCLSVEVNVLRYAVMRGGTELDEEAFKTSVWDLSGVPLRFGFLPPLGQEGLLVVSHALKLTVSMLWSRVGRFFWTHHVLKVNTHTHTKNHSQGQASFFTVLLPLHSNFFLLISVNLSLVHPVIQPKLPHSPPPHLSGPGSV